jgi:predicted PurR-regulated permease PerM
VALVLYLARAAVMLIYVSALIAMGFSPLVRVLQRPRSGGRGVPRTFAILTIYLVVLAGFALVAMTIVPPLVEQATGLWAELPQYFKRLQLFLYRHKLIGHIFTLEEAVKNAPVSAGGNAVSAVLVALWGLIGGLFGAITILILSFYFLIEAESLFKYFIRFLPERQRIHVTTASRAAVSKVSAWLRAQLILAGVMGVAAGVGLGLMGEPYFYVVALVAAIGETIPIIGPIIGGVTAVAIAMTQSAKLAVTVGVYFLILHQLEANILVPKIMERRVGVSPVSVIIALLIGGELFGLVGAILAVPTAAILSVIVEELSTASDRAIISEH